MVTFITLSKIMSEIKYQLLEETGHSYSGISDIIHNETEKTNQLLIQIDECYNELKQEQELLEKKLEQIKFQRGLLVSDFIFFHKALHLNEKPLTFVHNNEFTEIKDLDYDTLRINYEKHPITIKLD